MSVEIPAGMLAQVDQQKIHIDACLDGLIGTARQRIAEQGDMTTAWAAMAASLSNAGVHRHHACLPLPQCGSRGRRSYVLVGSTRRRIEVLWSCQK
jgi:hypothetical protein